MDSKRHAAWLELPETQWILGCLEGKQEELATRFKTDDFRENDTDLIDIQREARALGLAIDAIRDFQELSEYQEQEND